MLLQLQMFRLDEKESNHCQVAIMARTHVVASSHYNLPDGWVVEEVPRRYGCRIDKVHLSRFRLFCFIYAEVWASQFGTSVSAPVVMLLV